MKFEESVAAKCRYGDIAANIFGGKELIFENSEDDWQGFANILVDMGDGTFIHYEWSYGSCSGCDEWEARGLSDEDVEKEMRSSMAVFDNKEHLLKYLHIDEKTIKGMKYPSANSPTNASIPGMLRELSGDKIGDFTAMQKAAEEYFANPEA